MNHDVSLKKAIANRMATMREEQAKKNAEMIKQLEEKIRNIKVAPNSSIIEPVEEEMVVAGGARKPQAVAVRSAPPPRKPDADPAPAPKNQIDFFQDDGADDGLDDIPMIDEVV